MSRTPEFWEVGSTTSFPDFWRPHLHEGEHMLWSARTGSQALVPKYLVLLAASLVFLYGIVTVSGLPMTWPIEEHCAASAFESGCRKLYFFAWPGFVLLLAMAMIFGYRVVWGLMHPYIISYAITDQRALAHDPSAYRKSFVLQSVRLADVNVRKQLLLGVVFGQSGISFMGLPPAIAERAIYWSQQARGRA